MVHISTQSSLFPSEIRISNYKMRSVLFVSLLIVFVMGDDDMLYIDELEDLVSGNDRRMLKQMDDDKYTPRNQLQQQLNQILQQQSQQVQSTYQRIVNSKMQEDQMEDQRDRQRAESMGVGEIWSQLRDIETDMSISSSEAKMRKNQLINSLPDAQRRLVKNID